MATTNVEQIGLLVNNQYVPTKEYFEVRDPGRLTDTVAYVAKGTPDDVDKAVQAAHQAFLHWSKLNVKERVSKLLEASRVLSDSGEDLAPLLIRESGCVLWEAQTDFMLATGVLQYTASIAEEFLKTKQFNDEKSWISIEKVPRGVVGAIVPWNMPIVLTMLKLAPALVTGNTIVIKTSPYAPIALTIALKRMSEKLPDGVINVIHGEGDVGEALTKHPLVRKIAFTGGTQTAKSVMANAAQTIKNVTLELGGNDPAIVLDDVDVEGVLPKLLKGVFTRSGQICFAVKRIYVPEKIYKSFSDLVCQYVDEYRVGHGLDERATFGPLNNERQYKFVKDLIEKTKGSGATVMELGTKLDPAGWDNGYYLLPHVVMDIDHTAPLTSLEQFGPVIPLIPYKSEEQVIQWANDTEYGLCSSVWTSDFERGLRVARQIEAGSTFINSHSFESLDLRMPFGGFKQSGIGRELSETSLEEYVELHSIRYVK